MTASPSSLHSVRAGRIVALIVALGLLGGCVATTVPPSSTRPAESSATASATSEPARTERPPASDPPSVDPAEVTGVEYELPTPLCPPPLGPVVVPDVLVQPVGGGAPGVIGVRGSTTFATCTTTSTTDVAVQPRLPFLTVSPGDRLTLRIADGWSILRVEGFDAPAVGDGGNIQAPIDTPDGVASVEVLAPQRVGDARVSWALYVRRIDGRAVGMVAVSILVQLGPVAS